MCIRDRINAEEAIERDVFRAKVLKMEGVQGRKEKHAGSKWTENRKKRLSEKMKEYWRKKRTRNKELICGLQMADTQTKK